MAIRRVTTADAALVAPLIAELGYPTTGDELAKRIDAISRNPNDAVLVAELHGHLVGLVAVHSFETLHIPGRVGRITALVVASGSRQQGIGGQLLRAAEDHLHDCGCTRLEVTSAEQRPEAHSFYAAHGYVEKRRRFVKLGQHH